MKRIQFAGNIVAGFDTSDPVLREIYSELHRHEVNTDQTPAVRFRAEPINLSDAALPSSTRHEASNVDHIRSIPQTAMVSIKDAIRRRVGLLGWHAVVRTEGSGLGVTIYYDERIQESGRLLNWPLRFINRSFVWRYQNLAKVLLYNVVEPLVQLSLLRSGWAFVHASAVVQDGEAILVTGRGGAGKTSTMESLLADGDAQFISDDLCLVRETGAVAPYLKRVQIYPYNVSGASVVENHCTGLVSKLQWRARKRYAGSDGVRRRIDPGDRYEIVDSDTEIPIRAVLFVQRCSSEPIDLEPIDHEELARRSVSVIIEEFDQFWTEMVTLGTEGSTMFDTVDYVRAANSVYTGAFEDTSAYIGRVPSDSSGTDIANALLAELS